MARRGRPKKRKTVDETKKMEDSHELYGDDEESSGILSTQSIFKEEEEKPEEAPVYAMHTEIPNKEMIANLAQGVINIAKRNFASLSKGDMDKAMGHGDRIASLGGDDSRMNELGTSIRSAAHKAKKPPVKDGHREFLEKIITNAKEVLALVK